MRAAVVYTSAAILTASLAYTFIARGGPYFSAPVTIYDHVSRGRHPTIDDIRLCTQAAPLMNRGATVMIVKPSEKPDFDTTHIDTAAGLLPYHRVVAPALPPRSDYVITIREPLDNPSYRLVQSFPEGQLYARR